jgi:Uma2 family endonuclease
MTAIALPQKQELKSPEKKKTKVITWPEFQRKYLEREDQFKYEWVKGTVVKTPRTMDKTQLYILANLMRYMRHLQFNNPEIDGELIAEGDTFFDGSHRRPDIAYYTHDLLTAARYNEDVHPDFVIEVISTNDQVNRLVEKMKDYRAAKVKVIWHVFPEHQQIHVYRGKNMTVCEGDDLCSAEPVIEGFLITVNDVFK